MTQRSSFRGHRWIVPILASLVLSAAAAATARAQARNESRNGLGAIGRLGLDVPLHRRLALVGSGGVHWVPALDTLLFTFQGGARVIF